MVLFVVEHKDGALRKSARELAHAARALAEELGVEPVALVAGHGVDEAARQASGLARTVVVDDPALEGDRAEALTTAVATAAEALGARAVLVAATRSGLSYSPRVALRLDAPLLEDVTSLRSEGGALLATRFSFLSRVTETVRAEAAVVVVSVKPNVFPVAEDGAGGGVERLEVSFPERDARVRVGARSAAKTGRVALDEADVVVTGGRGVGGPEGFTALVEPLADALGAGIGSTRAAVDAGWRPYSEQVGQTGKTVAPGLYVALGVSGAVQHLSGMNRAKVIVAVNKDPDAPIFKVSDYGIVGDVREVVPALLSELGSGEG